MKLIIAGSRSFDNYELLKDSLLKDFQNNLTEIVSGTARGADKLGERYALEFNIPITYFKPDWELHRKSAGYIRNEQMAAYADSCICFWDGVSKGTKHMINLAKKYKLKLKVVMI